MLELMNISAGYGELQVLQGVGIKVNPGEIVALIGPNGAGKSTVLKTVFHITTRTGGKVFFNGEDISSKQTHELLSLGISYIPQGRVNFAELTVKENLELGCTSRAELKKTLGYVFKKFPALLEKQHACAYTLSGGQQQMLAIGRALMHQPKLLLMDEPSLGLSPKLQNDLFAIIKGLKKENIAVLLVEQNAKKAIEVADRTYLLEQGHVVLSGGKEILRNKKIKDVYLGGE